MPKKATDTPGTISLKLIVRSGKNPRKTFAEDALAELAESIKLHGVLQPIVVRPIVEVGPGGPAKTYELVAGERRCRAAELAGLTEIPATVRSMSEQEADQIRLIENDQREDLSPVERADGYHDYLQAHAATVEDLARATGKSPSTIRNFLRLRNLPHAARKALADGTISTSTATLIARVPSPLLRGRVTECVLTGTDWWHAASFADPDTVLRSAPNSEPLSYRATKRLIDRCCCAELKRAPFSRTRLDLVPGVGSCADCPRRAGNDPELVAEGVRADVCTDPVCFAAKTAAWRTEQEALAREAGQQVLTGKESENLFVGDGGELRYQSPYLDLKDQPWQDKKGRSIKQLLGKHLDPKDIVIATDSTGQLHRLVARKVAEPILKREHKIDVGYWAVSSATSAEEKKKAIEAGKLRRAETRAILEAAHRSARDIFGLPFAGVRDESGVVGFLRLLVIYQVRQSWGGGVLEDLCDRRGIKGNRVAEKLAAMCAAIEAMDAADLMGVMAEALADRRIVSQGDDTCDLARALGLDVAAIREKAAADLKAGVGNGRPLVEVVAQPAKNGTAKEKPKPKKKARAR